MREKKNVRKYRINNALLILIIKKRKIVFSMKKYITNIYRFHFDVVFYFT